MDSIDINEFEHFSRKELVDFNKEMRDIKERYITLEVDKIIERKKHEEYPELLGVHHYPELKEINFLTEAQKKQLDDELARNRGSHTSFSLKNYIHWDMHNQVYEFLIEKGILIRKIHLECSCGSWLSRAFDEKFKEQWIEDLKQSNAALEEVGLLESDEFSYFGYCDECEDDSGYLGELNDEFFENIRFDHHYVKIKERDKHWDNL